jgi:hypothetical protein
MRNAVDPDGVITSSCQVTYRELPGLSFIRAFLAESTELVQETPLHKVSVFRQRTRLKRVCETVSEESSTKF